MRRIRSNLRTFRLLLDPTWGTSLRAELAWYGNCLGQASDLHIIQDLVTVKGAEHHRSGCGAPARVGGGGADGRRAGGHRAPSGEGPADSS